MPETNSNSRGWQFNRQVNLTVLIQIFLLASLIVGSWVNLQRQLDSLQHDMDMLLQSSAEFQAQLAELATMSVDQEYRLRAVEKAIPKADIADGPS